MEKSMRRVEKLVQATNSALAQMKFSLMFDDIGGERNVRRGEKPKQRFCLEEDELQACQQEFKSEASEMLEKMDRMFGATDQNRKAVERIKEINRQMTTLRPEHAKPETEQSRQKLLSLIAEEHPTPAKTSSRISLPAKPSSKSVIHRTPVTLHPPTHSPPVNPKEELKTNILETRSIVDRGFHTARHLTQKMESLAKKEKTPSLEKTLSDVNVRSSEGKSETNETVRRGCRREKKDSEKVCQQQNSRVVEVKSSGGRMKKPHLRLQRLPSVHIRGGLQLQKVHNLEIPAGGDSNTCKANTGIHILSHENIERARFERRLETVRKENCCCSVGENPPGNYIECTHCGKVMRVQETRIDPRRVDEILRKCNFNVFDPRIDEFVEKCGAVDMNQWFEPAEPEKKEPEKRKPKEERQISLEDLSNRLSSKYRQEAEELEGSHHKLDTLLRTLLQKIEESKEVFEECHLFRGRELTRTKAIVVSLSGENDQKLEKRDVKNRKKSRTEVVRRSVDRGRVWEKRLQGSSSGKSWSGSEDRSVKVEEEEKAATSSSSSRQDVIEKSETCKGEPGKIPPSEVSTEKSENNYESDFESGTNEEEPEVIASGNKLSTISEVDSELERKLSNEQKACNSEEQQQRNRTPSEGSNNSKKSRSTPTELVTSLKDILTALKDQFARTETLAEKLTENVSKTEVVENPREEGLMSPWRMPTREKLMENLESARRGSKEVIEKGSTGGLSVDSLSEGGSSLGEVVVGGRKKGENSSGSEGRLGGSRRSSWVSSGRKIEAESRVKSDEISYSEGEIASAVIVESECCSSHSVGEVGDLS